MEQVRRATLADIDRLIKIRGAVAENRLSDPMSVSRSDYEHFIVNDRIWVFEIGGNVVGFSAGDGRDGTIWALFLDPVHQGAGIGTALLEKACGDLKADGHALIRLTTDPGTRAHALYLKQGWVERGLAKGGEMRLERRF